MLGLDASLIVQLPDSWKLQLMESWTWHTRAVDQTQILRPRTHISALAQNEDLPSSWDDLAQKT